MNIIAGYDMGKKSLSKTRIGHVDVNGHNQFVSFPAGAERSINIIPNWNFVIGNNLIKVEHDISKFLASFGTPFEYHIDIYLFNGDIQSGVKVSGGQFTHKPFKILSLNSSNPVITQSVVITQKEYDSANTELEILKNDVYNKLYQNALDFKRSQNESSETVRQIDESLNRHDITIDQAIEELKKILAGADTTKEDIELIDNDTRDADTIINNLNILLDNYQNDLDKIQGLIDEIPLIDPNEIDELDGRTFLELAKERLDNTINQSVPNIKNSLDLVFRNADQLGINVSGLHDNYIILDDSFSLLRNLGAGIIDNNQSLLILAGHSTLEIKSVVS